MLSILFVLANGLEDVKSLLRYPREIYQSRANILGRNFPFDHLVNRLWVIHDPVKRQGPEGTPPGPVLPEDPEAEGAVPYHCGPDVPPHGDGGEHVQGSLCETSMLRVRAVCVWR